LAFAVAAAGGVAWLLWSRVVALLANWQQTRSKGWEWVQPPPAGEPDRLFVHATPTELEAATELAEESAFVADQCGASCRRRSRLGLR
jgi:hypothetical protein